MNIKINKHNTILVLLIFSILTFGCDSKVNSDTIKQDLTSISADTISPSIDKFLFLKKGMSLNEIKLYLNENSIKYSTLQNLNNDESEFDIESLVSNNINFMVVYNYKIGDIVLDEFRLYFIENQLYKFKYFKYMMETDWGNENRGFNKVMDFKGKHINVISTLYEGLKSKYGFPLKSQVSTSETLVTYPAKDCNFFSVIWNEGPENVISDSEISIELENSFCYWGKESISGEKISDYSYNQKITVDFTDNQLNNYISDFQKRRNQIDNNKSDSVNNKKQQFLNDL